MTFQEKSFLAKKSLGQNFLHAPHIVGKMIHTAGISRAAGRTVSQVVLEIGPGKGVLTKGLLDAGAYVVAVEKDDRAIDFLKDKFAKEIQLGTFKLIHGDILDFDPTNFAQGGQGNMSSLPCGEYIIVANIPYYITGEFLRKFLESTCQPKKIIAMLQKEVAKRIATDKKESILSISVKTYGKPTYIVTVPARHFRPVPNVDSAVVLIDAISKDFFKEESSPSEKDSEKVFFTVLKAGFAHKRKVLIKNLENLGKNGIPRDFLEKIWEKSQFSLKIRAEELTIGDWKIIVTALTPFID